MEPDDVALHEACAAGNLAEVERLIGRIAVAERRTRLNAGSWEGESPWSLGARARGEGGKGMARNS
eukprot:SAG31_NODE_20119_length_583_cov_0.983471_1_plen_66_part_00